MNATLRPGLRVLATALAIAIAAPMARAQFPADLPSCKPPLAAPLQLWCSAGVLYEKSDFAAAIKPYSQLLELEKSNPTLSKTAWIILVDNLGMAYGITGDLANAEATFNYGISKDPNYPLFYYNLACTYAERKDLPRTLDYLKETYARKANVLPTESIPDPLTDDSFKRFLKDTAFVAQVKRWKSVSQ